MIKNIISDANVVHSVSPLEASTMISFFPVARDKVVIIPNGVDEDLFSYEWKGQSSNYMIYAGRIEKYKRLDIAVNLSKELGLKLVIVGTGTYRKNIEKYAKKFKVPEEKVKRIFEKLAKRGF